MTEETRTSIIISMIFLVCMMAIVGRCTVDSVVQTAEIQEKYYSKPVTFTYSRPAAYRLASPTQAQMDSLHHVRQAAGVR